MGKGPARANQDTARTARDAAKTLGSAIRDLILAGDVPALERLLDAVGAELSVEQTNLMPHLREAEEEERRLRERLGSDMKAAATEAGCDFKYEPPFVTFGCVRLREKKPGLWDLAILDDIAVETVASVNGVKLATRALQAIEEIEAGLARVPLFTDELKAAYQAISTLQPTIEKVSPNLLMLLCASGRNVRKQLASAEVIPHNPISRAQFGYLLERMRELSSQGGGTQIKVEGATVHATEAPFRFISVPRGSDPRRATQHTPIAYLTLVDEHH